MSTTAAPKPPATKGKLIERLSEKFGIDADKMLATLKATAFRQRDANTEVTNEQMMALLVVAEQYGLNPFTKELYAYPDKNLGIVPVVSVDGWVRIINEHAQFDGWQFGASEELVTSPEHKTAHAWMECTLFRKDRQYNSPIREYFEEVYRGPQKGYNGPWQTHTKRMHRHKTMIQAARVTFGFAGIYDEDEAQRIIEGEATRVGDPKALTDQRTSNPFMPSAIAPAKAKEKVPVNGNGSNGHTEPPKKTASTEEPPPPEATGGEPAGDKTEHTEGVLLASDAQQAAIRAVAHRTFGDDGMGQFFQDFQEKFGHELRHLPANRVSEAIQWTVMPRSPA